MTARSQVERTAALWRPAARLRVAFMRVWMVVVVAAALAGCGDPGAPAPDAGMQIIVLPDARPEGCPDDKPPITAFFGEACKADPYPANTVCHGGAGWCIDGVCRPMCEADCPRCPGAELHFAPAGACYCTAPQ